MRRHAGYSTERYQGAAESINTSPQSRLELVMMKLSTIGVHFQQNKDKSSQHSVTVSGWQRTCATFLTMSSPPTNPSKHSVGMVQLSCVDYFAHQNTRSTEFRKHRHPSHEYGTVEIHQSGENTRRGRPCHDVQLKHPLQSQQTTKKILSIRATNRTECGQRKNKSSTSQREVIGPINIILWEGTSSKKQVHAKRSNSLPFLHPNKTD